MIHLNSITSCFGVQEKVASKDGIFFKRVLLQENGKMKIRKVAAALDTERGPNWPVEF
jgi:hypothetical protein